MSLRCGPGFAPEYGGMKCGFCGRPFHAECDAHDEVKALLEKSERCEEHVASLNKKIVGEYREGVRDSVTLERNRHLAAARKYRERAFIKARGEA